jgi:hypothetical protein
MRVENQREKSKREQAERERNMPTDWTAADRDFDELEAAVHAPGAGPLSMRLRTHGNPDRSQYAPVSDPVDIRAKTIEELQERVKAYQNWYNFGMGNWPEPPIKNVAGKTIGTISYSLRFRPAHGLEGHEPMLCRRKACRETL